MVTENDINATLYYLQGTTNWRAALDTLPTVQWNPQILAQLIYTTNQGAINITGYTGAGGALVIPATINNLPVDIMQSHAPGLVIGCDVGADHYALGRRGKRRINIFQVLMHSGMVNSASSAAAQRALADVLLKPPLVNIDLLNWRAFDRAIQAGYDYAMPLLETLPDIPRLAAAAATVRGGRNSLAAELQRRLAASTL